MQRLILSFLALSSLFVPGLALAEGTDQLATTQALRSGAQLYVDIVAPGAESIRWVGVGNVSVTAPDGTPVTTLASGETADTTGLPAGAYGLTTEQGQVVGIRWDVEVVGQEDDGGRLHSYDWMFNAGSFAASRATNASFYAVVPGGDTGETAVVELLLDGLAGYVYNVNANRIGVDGPDGGRSVSMYGHTVTPEFPIYLRPPTVATYVSLAPRAYGLDYIGGVSLDVDGTPISPCNQVVPGESFGRFQFDTNVEGTYHLVCDLDGDGLFEGTNDDDFLAVGPTSPGLNTVLWNGVHAGTPVAPGNYACRVRINTGEFHYVGSDIETSYQGMRMYEVRSDGSRSPLAMRWNDSAVQANANTMLSGELGLETSGEAGIDPGPYGLPAVANLNARSWGNHTSTGKGNQNYLDTYVWLASDTSADIEVAAVSGLADTDLDGLGDFAESCFYGTDPNDPDSDDDGIPDGLQYGLESSSGTVGGLESNGRLGAQLARRAIARSRLSAPAGLTEPVGSVRLALTDPIFGEVTTLLDTLRIDGLERVDSTPNDLPELTNAERVYAFDLVEDGVVAGSLLAVETAGETYEHSKALCDRAGGAALVDLGLLPALGALQATYRDEAEGTLDQAVELKLYRSAEGRWTARSQWLRDEYPAPAPDQRVLNVQVWGHRPGLARELVGALLETLAGADLLRSAASTVLDEPTVDTWTRPSPATATVPPVAVTAAVLLGADLGLDLERFAGSAGAIRLRIDRVAPDGGSMPRLDVDLDTLEGSRSVSLDVGLVRDLTVEVLHQDRVVDRLWLSDGAWAAYDDAVWGGSTDATFDSTCEGKAHRADGVALSGCARTSASRVDRFLGVARHLPRGVATADARSASFWFRADAEVEVCAEDTSVGARTCQRLAAAPEGRYGEVDLTPLAVTGERVRLVTLTRTTPGSLEMSALSLARGRPMASDGSDGGGSGDGCSAVGGGPGGSGLCLLVLLALGRRRGR